MHSLISALLLQVSVLTGSDVQARISTDVKNERPIVAHVVVALCDNRNQGIVPVAPSLGDGQNPNGNLYWGAAYGVRTFLKRHKDFELVPAQWKTDSHVLDRAVFVRDVRREDSSTKLFVVAEAWDGRFIGNAISQFAFYAAGYDPREINLGENRGTILAGGESAVIVFVGHNGLMDFSAQAEPGPNADSQPSSSMVLACKSKPYFLELLRSGGSHPLLLTTGLMAPEAYTLEAALFSIAAGGTAEDVKEAAATAYDKYQKCGMRGARNLFSINH